MAEDNYQSPLRRSTYGRTIFYDSRQGGKTERLKLEILKAAAESPTGRVDVMRMDRESGEWVTDIITAYMPLCEVIL